MQLSTSRKMSDMLLATGVVLIALALALRWFHENRTPANNSLGVAQLLSMLKEELRRADEQQTKAGTAPLFRIGSADLEINYVLKKTVGGEIRPVILPVGASVEQANERTQKVTVHMTMIDDTTTTVQEIPDPASAATRPGRRP
jgi:hypothetical protein